MAGWRWGLEMEHRGARAWLGHTAAIRVSGSWTPTAPTPRMLPPQAKATEQAFVFRGQRGVDEVLPLSPVVNRASLWTGMSWDPDIGASCVKRLLLTMLPPQPHVGRT